MANTYVALSILPIPCRCLIGNITNHDSGYAAVP